MHHSTHGSPFDRPRRARQERPSARAPLTLPLVAPDLIDVVDGLDRPWRWLVEALLLALLALAFFVAAQRSRDQRFGWLLSSSVAAGLAIAASYNLLDAAAIPAVPAAGVVIIIAIMLFLTWGATRQPPRR